ncbi:MAG: tetratricopeptide repeat protein [Cytophagales bacterium]
MRFNAFLFTLLLFSFQSLFGQENIRELESNPIIDSLLNILVETKEDSNTVNHLHDLAYEYKFIGELEESQFYADKTLALSQKINWHKGRGKAYNIMGTIGLAKSQYDSSIAFFERALDIADSFELESLKGTVLVNQSNVYSERSDYSKALVLLYEGLKVLEKLKDDQRIGGTLTNIGIIYYYQEEFDTALHYYERAIHIFKKINDVKSLSYGYTNIGGIYANQGKFTKSLYFFKKSAEYKLQYKDYNGLSINYQNIAEILNLLNSFPLDSLNTFHDLYQYANIDDVKNSLQDSAKYYLKKGIKIARQINSPYNIMQSYSTLGAIYFTNQEYRNAINAFLQALKMSQEIGAKQNQLYHYNHLYDTYKSIKKYESALVYHELYTNLKDSIFSQEKQQEIGRQEAKYEYEKKQALQNAEYQKQLALDQEELKRQKMGQLFLGAIIFIVIVVSFFIYRALRLSRKQRREIEDQKMIIEKKNLEILSSIRYASRIQNALLKEEETVAPVLPEHFVFFRPRDIVSGDFYWSVKQDSWWYLAVADCTGHGVPGAFLTMLGTAYLNEIISTEVHITPDMILNQLREKIVNQLSQSDDIEDSKDGMDISLIALNLNTLEAEWAGANNPIYIIREKRSEAVEIMESEQYVLAEIKGDKQPIGFSSHQKPFTKHHIKFKKGELFYLMSDGFADQFGGPKNKKYRYKPLKQLVLNLMESDIHEQKNVLSKEFDDWKGNQEQLDDVCVLGVRV